MKISKWARFIPAVVLVLAGCKGFWDVPSGSGSGGGGGTASGFFYVLNQKTAQVAGFSFAAGAKTLTPVNTNQYSLSASPFSAAISPNGGFLYVGTAGGIFVYSVDATTGALTILSSGNAISQDTPSAMAVSPSGAWLIEAVSVLGAGSTVNAIPLNQTTGLVLTGGQEQTATGIPAGAVVQQIAITRASAPNPYVFLAMSGSGIAAIPFTTTANNPFGTVTTKGPKNSAGGDNTLALDASAQVLYVGETAAVTDTSGNKNTGGVRMFTIGGNTTPLSEASGSPFASGGVGPAAILPTGSFVYVANRTVGGSNSGNIKAFAINTTGGVPTALSDVSSGTISAGSGTVGLAEESKGTYVLAVNSGGTPDLNAYTIQTTGALKSYATNATGSDPVGAAAIVAKP